MKKIISLVTFLLVAFFAQAQFPTYPTVKQSLGSKSTEVYSKGILSADSGYVPSVFPDTTTANRGYIKNIAGITIRVADTVYFRNAATTKWLAFYSVASGPLGGWGLTGNLGTTAGTNFIGTTDAQPLLFKVNNTVAGLIDLVNGLGPGLGNTSIGLSTLENNTTGTNNTAFGQYALRNNTDGLSNVAIGASSLGTNTIGYYNTAVGQPSLAGVTSGIANTGVGRFVLDRTTTGRENVAMGFNAGDDNTTGSHNVFIGSQSQAANTSGTGSYNIVIGDSTFLPSGTANYQMAIGNMIYGTGINGRGIGISTGNIGIGVKAPSEKLEVAGNIRFSGALMPNNLPGTSGDIFKSNGAGASPTWVSPSSLGLGTVTSVTGTEPVQVATGTTTPVISMKKASATDSGWVSTGTQTFAGAKTVSSAFVSSTSTTTPLLIGGTGTTSPLEINATSSGSATTGANITFKSGTTTIATMLNNGNVGIGVASPSSLLHIKAATPIITIDNTSDISKVSLTHNGTEYSYWQSSYNGGETRFANSSGGYFFTWYPNGTELMRLSTSGALQLGTAGNPAASAALDITSTTKGLLIPRMTTAQRTSISSPATGLLVFDTDLNKVYQKSASAWMGLVDNVSNESITGEKTFNTSIGIAMAAPSAGYVLSILGDQYLEGSLWLHNGSVIGRLFQNGNNDIESSRNLIAPRLQLGSTGDDPETSILKVVGIVEYADNAAALTAGLTAGDVYRSGDILKIVH